MSMVTLAPSRRLLDAAKHGDIEGCLASAGAGADLNSGDPSYVTTNPSQRFFGLLRPRLRANAGVLQRQLRLRDSEPTVYRCFEAASVGTKTLSLAGWLHCDASRR